MGRIALGALLAVLLVVALTYLAGRGVFGSHEEPGEPTAAARPQDGVARESAAVRAAAEEIGVARPKQVLFGDFHVHTTFSPDAFMLSLPAAVGEGAHPPADACDFARFCSALDFWSINDHAEGMTPAQWRETVDSIRSCNAVTGDVDAPDTVAFLGWEWTQVGQTPDEHWGHKNVVVRGLGDDRAYDMRERALDTWPSTVVHSLWGLQDYARTDSIRAQCERIGAGDAHVLRRLRALDERNLLPDWATTRTSLQMGDFAA